MAAEVLSGISQAIGACFGWFDDIIEYLGFYGIVIGAFTIVTITRFLLTPIVGAFNGALRAGASDMVSGKSKKKNSGNNQKSSGGNQNG